MAARATIAQLAARKAKLQADLNKVNAEIAARAGQTDNEQQQGEDA